MFPHRPAVAGETLFVSSPTGPAEQEAEQAARHLAQGPQEMSGLGRGSMDRMRGQGSLQDVASTTPVAVKQVSRSGGHPLDPATRALFEPRFDMDFGRVRIVADARAEGAAVSVNARAFAIGETIVFDRGVYAPQTSAGRAILAHELAHVAQYRLAGAGSTPRLFRSKGANADAARTEVQRLAGEMSLLAAKNAWSGVDRSYRDIEALGEDAFALAPNPANLYFLGAQAARNLGDIRRYKSLAQRAKTALIAAGSTADDPQLQGVEDELTAIDKTSGGVSIAPRSKRSGKSKEGEPFGPELVPAAMPFAGDQRASIEHARAQILESGSFSGLLPAGVYTLGDQTFTVIAGTNISGVLWGE
ncbi:MAG: DUF4157 domain-containing protein [Nitrospirota bacterium]